MRSREPAEAITPRTTDTPDFDAQHSEKQGAIDSPVAPQISKLLLVAADIIVQPRIAAYAVPKALPIQQAAAATEPQSVINVTHSRSLKYSHKDSDSA